MTKITDRGYPTHDKKYHEAHSEADTSEKKKYPKNYPKTKKLLKKLGRHELMSTESKEGKIRVERKFKKYSKELAYHEKIEHKALNRLNKK
ncbi:MAG TPA: hypothetical protein VK559_04765 [Ferruginibacter sp.]|nr:hypothetical protein [Ferruginibacter sp.]